MAADARMCGTTMEPPDTPEPGTPEPGTPEDRLRHLLLGHELALIRQLEKAQRRLGERVGDDAALTDSVTRVIVDVLRDAGVREHQRLAGTLAPLVLASLREEIRNSKDMLVDALYPLTGRLVAATVSNAFRDLVETLNRQLDRTVSPERWLIKAQSLATGVSEAELMLRRHPPFRIESLLLIHRPTGLLIDRVTEDAEDDADGQRLGGLLTAIMAFTRDAFGSDAPGELRTLAVGDAELFLRASSTIILAVKARGTPPAGFETSLEGLFVDFLERWGKTLAAFNGDAAGAGAAAPEADVRQDLHRRFATLTERAAAPPRRSPTKALAVLGLAAVAVIGLVVWTWIEDRRIAAIEDAATAVIAAEPRLLGWPLSVDYAADEGTLHFTGLAPDAATREDLTRAIAAALPTTPVAMRIGMPSDAARAVVQALAADIDDVRATLAGIETRLAAMNTDAAAQRTRRDGPLQDRLAGLEQHLAGLAAALDDPRRALIDRAARTAIFFADGTAFRDPPAAGMALDTLAGLLARTPASLRLRVVGYADSLGDPGRQIDLSLDRAKVVADALVGRGVATERLIPVGRGIEEPLQPVAGPASANRRVEFAPVFAGE